ncbi:MAG: Coenzyme F420 hydrogenase/dehydrogenase, beta subunit C-terminal domain [Oscillospiraceae bacterium]|nr:Coenzyme F420 hydrogenase/dehydrogenase, beta subunit C-terminal domain [Oscillospiraceae bacterium]
MIDITILLFGQFGGERAQVARFFGRAELLDYEAPLGLFVTSSFRSLAADADVAIHGGEPRYKPFLTAAKKAGCKLALWGCEAAWVKRCHAVLPLFDLIFARDKEAYAALREAGIADVVLPKADAPEAPVEAPPPAPEPVPEPEFEDAPSPLPELEPDDAPPSAEESEPLIDLSNLPALEPLSEDFDLPPDSGYDASQVIQFSPRVHAYGVINRNENIRAASAAGGVFTLLCEECIGRGGVVFGARYNEAFETVHVKADRLPECVPMRGVKYAISETEGIYDQAVSCLRQQKPVLFTGTACQIKRLYACLGGKDHPLLLTADMVCGGAADPAVFAAYLKYVEEKNGAPATAIDMSGKPMGLVHAKARIGSENKTYEVSVNSDPFLRAYRAGLCLKPECYNCPHREEKRGSDLTLGSFPGGRRHIPELYDDKGASLVLAHTQKGRDMMDALAKRSIVREVPPDALTDYNAALVTVPAKHKHRDRFYGDMANMRFDKAVARSIGPAVWGILTAERSILPSWAKIKRIIAKR